MIVENSYNEETLDKVLGITEFISDLSFENALVAKALRSPFPHAKVLGVDTSEAQKVPGVAAVFTAKDVPGTNRFGVDRRDRPILCDEIARSITDVVALLVGESEEAVDVALQVDEIVVTNGCLCPWSARICGPDERSRARQATPCEVLTDLKQP